MARTGSLNNNWRGGRSVASHGYVLVRVGIEHHLSDVRGYAYEHRIVAERKIGRRLLPNEHVHHIDGNKQNNAPENLEVLTAEEHRAEHRAPNSNRRRPGEDNLMVSCRCGCGTQFPRYDATGRPRDWASGHNPPSHREVGDAVLGGLATGPMKAGAIAELIGRTRSSVSAALAKLKARGLVRRIQTGMWERTEER